MTPLPVLFLLLMSSVPSVSANDDWATQSAAKALAVRSQRDVSANITIDQLGLSGVALSDVLFDEAGYTLEALDDVRDLLDVGVQVLAVDLYWLEQLKKFQLCPAPMNVSSSENVTREFTASDGIPYKCQSTLTLADFSETVLSYLTDSDTNLYANLIVLVFRIRSISDTSSTITSENIGTSNDTLGSVMTNFFSSRLYTPDLLIADRTDGSAYSPLGVPFTGWPKLSNFLFSEKKRVIAAVVENELPKNTTYNTLQDSGTVFNATLYGNTVSASNISEPTNCTEESLQSWRFAIDSHSTPYDTSTFAEAITYGFSPIINSTISSLSSSIPAFMNDSLWSWESTQPYTQAEAKKEAEANGESSTQSAYNCAVFSTTTSRWRVANCYQEKHVVCKSRNGTAYDWAVTLDTQSYFHADDACSSLPDSDYVSLSSTQVNSSTVFEFSVPKTALEQYALSQLLYQAELNDTEVWIDMNSIAISDCWVTGGPYASCPYQKVSSQRNFVAMLTPAAVFCGVFLFGILLLRLRRVPIQDNRKYWKKLVNQYAENEYEGVPS